MTMMKACYISAHMILFVVAQFGTYWYSYGAIEGDPYERKMLMFFVSLTAYIVFATYVFARDSK